MRRQLQSVVSFLMGQSELEGVNFGEKHPTKAGAYWWRLNLRAAMHEVAAEPSNKEVQEAFEAWFAGERFHGRSEQMQIAWQAAVKWMRDQ